MDAETVSFASDQEMHEVMRMKEYATDPSLRQVVSKMIENRMRNEAAAKSTAPAVVSRRELSRAMSDPAGARKLVLREITNETAQKMFMAKDENGKLKYENSPSYREEVRQFLIDHNSEIDSVLGDRFQDRNANKGAVRVTFGEGSAAVSRQAIADKKAADDKALLAERHARIDAGVSPDVTDLGGVRH
jgi:hypothetical protein